MTALTSPIAPHELPKADREQMHDLVQRVSARAVIEGAGHDLLLRIYMAGFHHGVAVLGATPTLAPTPSPSAQEARAPTTPQGEA